MSELTGQSVSHTGVWNAAQTMGEALDDVEQAAAARAVAHRGAGTLEVPVLFEEQDGVYLSIQGKDRKR
ncbi:MAG: hypothetical protein LBL15_08010 [Oscillospiraceae bacterium]|nr:hypothetical protein [Oscillospiraceae bacterium]